MPTFPQITNPAQSNAPVLVNEMATALEHVATYARAWQTSSGLTHGYYGGPWGDFLIVDGTLALTGSNTNYVVVAVATGVQSASTSATNWNDTTNYRRVYKFTTSASAITATEDHRTRTGGVFGAGSAAGTVTSLTASNGARTSTGSAITATGIIYGDSVTNAQTGTTYTVLTGDRGTLVTHNNGSAIAVTLPQAGASFPNGWYYDTKATGAGTTTITPTTSTINGGASLALTSGQSARIVSDGTNYTALLGSGAGSGTVTSVDASGGVETASGSAITTTGTIRGSHKINAQTGTSYAIASTDRGKHVTLSNAASIAATIAQAGTAGFEDGYFAILECIGAGAVTLTPTTSTINGAATLVLDGGMAAIVYSDGTNYRSIVFDAAGVPVNAQTGTTYTYLSGDRGKLVTHTNGSAIAGTLPQATGAFGSTWFMWVQNRGAGTLTITPTTSTIDGAASLALTTGQGCLIASDGTNYYTMRGIGGSGGSVATDTIWDAAGDTVYGTGSNTATRLALGTALQVYRVNAGATAPEWATFSGSTIGRHMLPISAANMVPALSSPCGTAAQIGPGGAGQPDTIILPFDSSSTEYAVFAVEMPESWDEGTISFVPVCSHAATTTNFGMVFQLQAVAVSNDDTLAVSFGTAQSSVVTGGTTDDLYKGAESSAITIAGSPAAGDTVFYRLLRLPSDGSDTMAIDARLHGIRMYYTTAAETD